MCRCDHPAVAEVAKITSDGGPDSPFRVIDRIRLTSPLGGRVLFEDEEDEEDQAAEENDDYVPAPGMILFNRKTGARIRIIGEDIVSMVTSYAWGLPSVHTTEQTVWIVEHESRAYYLGHHAAGKVKTLSARDLLDYAPIKIGDDQ